MLDCGFDRREATLDSDTYRLERLFIDHKLSEAYWPIELCIAWVITGSKPGAAAAWLSLRFETEGHSDWVVAEAALLGDLRAGNLTAEAADVQGERRPLTEIEWRNLKLKRVGAHYQAHSPTGQHQFRDIQLNASKLQKRHPGPSVAMLSRTTSIAAENAAKRVLIKSMKENPQFPTSKAELLRQSDFCQLSKRAFDRAYSAAVLEADAPAWGAAGRRPKSPQ